MSLRPLGVIQAIKMLEESTLHDSQLALVWRPRPAGLGCVMSLGLQCLKKKIRLVSKPTLCCLRRRGVMKEITDERKESSGFYGCDHVDRTRLPHGAIKDPPPLQKHTHTPISDMYGSTAAHCAHLQTGCLRSDGERKIGGGEWLHQESRRREKRTVSFLYHTLRDHTGKPKKGEEEKK